MRILDLLVHLETFVAVAEQRNFSRAADRLGVAQPLLSRRIKALEAELGRELFDRSRRQIRVTGFGALLLPHAQDVLSRASHLRSVAESARSSTVLALGVPPDCEPTALARIIRAAIDHGIPLSVREMPAAARGTALAEGSLACALVHVPAETTRLTVPLGLASAASLTAARGGRGVRLDSLRPRRGVREAPRTILLTPEDDLPRYTDRLHRAMAAAGLPASRARSASSSSAAAAEVMAGSDLLLCEEPFARRHHLAWSALDDVDLHRGYELAWAPDWLGTDVARTSVVWLVPLLGGAVGAQADTLAPALDARSRLTGHA